MTDLNGLKVLLVEDEMLIAAEMEATLEDLGCEVVGPFARVGQAREALAHTPVAAPGRDGDERGE